MKKGVGKYRTENKGSDAIRKKLIRLRDKKRMTQKEFAEYINVPYGTYCQYEQGYMNIGLKGVKSMMEKHEEIGIEMKDLISLGK